MVDIQQDGKRWVGYCHLTASCLWLILSFGNEQAVDKFWWVVLGWHEELMLVFFVAGWGIFPLKIKFLNNPFTYFDFQESKKYYKRRMNTLKVTTGCWIGIYNALFVLTLHFWLFSIFNDIPEKITEKLLW